MKLFNFSLLCNCSKAALNNGNKLFGITDNLECWGFNGTASDLMSLQKSSHCVMAYYTKPACVELDMLCAGTSEGQENSVSSFIYLAIGKNISNS